MEVSFLGATGTVTGSRYPVRATGLRRLVDCGLFQGEKALRLRNWAEFPVVNHADRDVLVVRPASARID